MQAANTASALTQDEELIAKKVSKCDASMFRVLRKRYDEKLRRSLLLNFFIFILHSRYHQLIIIKSRS